MARKFQVLSLTDAAAARIRDMMAQTDEPKAALRIGIRNGGCAGMSYTMEWTDAIQPGEDVVEDKGAKVVVDPKAVLFLLGAQMDFRADKLSAGFVFENPNQTSACGCGESVALAPASQAALDAAPSA